MERRHEFQSPLEIQPLRNLAFTNTTAPAMLFQSPLEIQPLRNGDCFPPDYTALNQARFEQPFRLRVYCPF